MFETQSQLIFAYKEHFAGSDRGKAILADLAKVCWMDRLAVPMNAAQPIDPLRIAFIEGKRSVFLEIQRMIDYSDRDLSALEKEEKLAIKETGEN